MLSYRDNPFPPIIKEYLIDAPTRTQAILTAEYWMESSMTQCIKHHVDLATMRATFYFISKGRPQTEELKDTLANWLTNRYRAKAVYFFQSPEEKASCRPATLYFHAIVELG